MARPRETSDAELLDRVGSVLARRESLERWSLAEVGRGAGVVPATLVKRFGSRRGLLLALSRSWVESVPADLPSGGVTPHRALYDWVADAFAPAGTRGAAVAGIQMLLEDLADAELTELLREGWRRQLAHLARLLAAAAPPRLSDPDQAAGVLFDALTGARLRAAAGDTAPTPTETLDLFWRAWT